jgi:hypothetical protein
MRYILLLLLCSSFINGQNDVKFIEYKSANIYEKDLEVKYLGLSPFSSSNSKIHFRYQKGFQIIDIISNDSITFQASMINYIFQYSTNKNGNENKKLYFEKTILDTTQSNKIANFLLTKKTHNIPTDSLINGWLTRFFDCSSINIKTKINVNFSYKKFTCISGQNTDTPFVNEILTLEKFLADNLAQKESYSLFTEKLPKGFSYFNGYSSIYKLTNEQIIGWNKAKPIRDYQSSIKDTITKFIELKLNEQELENGVNCYGDFTVTFTKRGNLKSIHTKKPYDSDDRKCIKYLKRRFRIIKIDFVDPKYEFSRQISNWQNKFTVYDNSIY